MLTADIEALLRRHEPDATVLAVDSHDWVRDPYSKGSWVAPLASSGHVGTHHSEPRRREGRLVMSGSDIAGHLTATLEAAVASGVHSAQETLALLD